MTRRVLIAEPIAERGLDKLREAGFEVDVRTGMTPEELQAAVVGAAALVIRSATQVTPEVLAAGTDLVVVGRAGIGLDNVDVDEATKRGVMVVNAPQSNIVSAAEHTIALLLALSRNVSQADRDLKAGAWNRAKWEGVELYGKTLGVVGLGRVGALVAQRMAAFDMQVLAYDPFVSKERARQMGVSLVATLEELMAEADFLTVHLPKTAETIGLFDDAMFALAKPGLRIVNTARGAIIDEGALARAIESGKIAGAALDVFATEPTTESPLFGLESVVVTPHLGASTVEAQDKAGDTIADMVVLALSGEFVPFAVNLAAREASATVQPFLPLAERLGQLFVALAGGSVDTLEVSYEGQIADYDCQALTLGILKGVLASVVDEAVTFVNAPQIADERGLDVRETKGSATQEFVNLISVRGRADGRPVHVAGTLAGRSQEPRIVGVDEHTVDLPPSRYMLFVHNDDRPGMIGVVGTALGTAGINISDMDVAPRREEGHAVMMIATDRIVNEDVMAALRATPGILVAQEIELP